MATLSPLNTEPFFIDNGTMADYPVGTGGRIVFGNEAAHSDFAVPMARFQFYNTYGVPISLGTAPIIYMRMGGQFQTGLINTYNETTNIYGNPAGDAGDDALFALPTGVTGGLTALYKQITGGLASGAGFLQSAGSNGKAQYEFLTRRVLNTFQQLIYQGPTFRRYSLPFTMKPTSLDEAKAMINIIKSFRIAASAKGAAAEGGREAAGRAAVTIGDVRTRIEGETDVIGAGVIGEVINQLSATPITFGYPDMCSFEIIMVKAVSVISTDEADDDVLTQIFGSEFCVIENVQVDYGSQNKMLFFDKDTETDGKYYPAEVTLTIGLKETTLALGQQITQEQNSDDTKTRTIF